MYFISEINQDKMIAKLTQFAIFHNVSSFKFCIKPNNIIIFMDINYFGQPYFAYFV